MNNGMNTELKEIKLTNLTKRHKKNTMWPKEKKLQVVVQYLALGSLKLVSATTGMDYALLRQWKLQPWWKEFENEIRNTENLKLDTKLTSLVEKSLEAVADRMEGGDYIMNNKTGQIIRKPVNMKDAAKVSVDLLTKRELLRGNATARTETQVVPMQDQLANLAKEFARMAAGGGKTDDVIDVEMVEVLEGDLEDALDSFEQTGEDDALHDQRETGLQEGSGEIHIQAGSNQEAN
jgi:hypothetical protein